MAFYRELIFTNVDMYVRSYRLIIVEDSLALAAYYILRKLLEVKAKKIISIFSLRMLVCITE